VTKLLVTLALASSAGGGVVRAGKALLCLLARPLHLRWGCLVAWHQMTVQYCIDFQPTVWASFCISSCKCGVTARITYLRIPHYSAMSSQPVSQRTIHPGGAEWCMQCCQAVPA